MTKNKPNGNGADFGFEEKLWQTVDKLGNNMDAPEYKCVVLGLLLLKDVLDAFKNQYQFLIRESVLGADLDEYRAEKVFWVAPKARRNYL